MAEETAPEIGGVLMVASRKERLEFVFFEVVPEVVERAEVVFFEVVPEVVVFDAMDEAVVFNAFERVTLVHEGAVASFLLVAFPFARACLRLSLVAFDGIFREREGDSGKRVLVAYITSCDYLSNYKE